jgi:hypothetical protein
MNELAITGAKFCITDQGIDFTGDLSRKEWDDLGTKIARVGKSIGFIIGDWFNYGNHKWGGDGRQGGMYADAIALTGFDYGTLSNFANVAKRVQFPLRNGNLDYNHHAVVAKLKSPEDQKHWLDTAEKHDLSVRRLRMSVNSGRIVSIEEMQGDPADKGTVTYMVWINRLRQWWCKRIEGDPVKNWDAEDRATLKRDLQPLVDIYNTLSD